MNEPRDDDKDGSYSTEQPDGEEIELSEEDAARLLSYSAPDDARTGDSEGGVRDDTREFSPRGLILCPLDERNAESEASSSRACISYYDLAMLQHIRGPWRGFFHRWKLKSSAKGLSTFPHMGIPKLPKRGGRERRNSHSDSVDDPEFCFFKPSWRLFTITELEAATDYFRAENLIGKGGFSEVYKGCLADGQLVAIKRLTRGKSDEQTSDFLSELGIIVHINHPNTAKLIGFGVEGGMHLVLQLSPHGSLASLLHDSKEKLDWNIRYKIAVGTADGLEYLHDKCQKRIIHRDIKAANILLSEDFDAQICDFGLAKWLPDKLAHHTASSFEGTFGYLAPEYLSHGIIDEKTDVFAFGVLLLELITGRKALDNSQKSLVLWARPFLEKNSFKELVDPSLGDNYDQQELDRTAQTASLCTQNSPLLRPRMAQAVRLLRGEEEHKAPPKPHRTYSEELLDAEEYNATKYLKEMHQHKKLALEL